MPNWIEVRAEDGRGNRTTLRLARTQRGIKILAPAATVMHVVGEDIDILAERLRALAEVPAGTRDIQTA